VTPSIRSAFVLGAGLGKRLRPLTESCPKPLVPVFNKPLLTFALDHLRGLGVERFTINTHHAPEKYSEVFEIQGQAAAYGSAAIQFVHEPVLLDTGGGIRNAMPLIGQETFLVHNGDILSDLPIEDLISHHKQAGNLVTLALRSSGGPLQIQCNPDTGQIEDIGQRLGGSTAPAFLFSGIYILEPDIFPHIPDGEIISIIPILADLIRRGAPIGGAVLDQGNWFDLGNRGSYLDAHRHFHRDPQLAFKTQELWPNPVHPTAKVADSAELRGASCVGAGSVVRENAILEDSIVWEGTEIALDSHLKACIVRDRLKVGGDHAGQDF